MKKSMLIEGTISLALLSGVIGSIILMQLIWPLMAIDSENFFIIVYVFILIYVLIAPFFIIWVFYDIILKLIYRNTRYVITNSRISSLRGAKRVDLPFSSINYIIITQESWLEKKYGHGSIATIRIFSGMKKKIQLWGVPDYVFLRNLIYEKMAKTMEVESP